MGAHVATVVAADAASVVRAAAVRDRKRKRGAEERRDGVCSRCDLRARRRTGGLSLLQVEANRS